MEKHMTMKLITSETIVSKVVSENEYGYWLEMPTYVNYTYNAMYQQSYMYLVIVNPLNTTDNIFIRKENIVFATTIDVEFTEYYENHIKKSKTKFSNKAKPVTARDIESVLRESVIEEAETVIRTANTVIN